MSEEQAELGLSQPLHYKYPFPMAAVCGSVILYSREHGAINLLTTKRTKKMGGGRSHAAGGFYEVKDMFNKKTGAIQYGQAEIYREMVEELGEEIKEILPYDDFQKKAAFLMNFMVNKGNKSVNCVTVFTLEADKKLIEKIMSLPPTEEREGFVLETIAFDTHFYSGDKNGAIRKQLKDFLYAEEIKATEELYTKLYHKHRDQAHPGGW